MNSPDTFERKILLAVAGTTPQILTETLYALVHATPAFIPSEIHVLTTAEGAHRIQLQLLDGMHGQFHAFCRDFGLTGKIAFGTEFIHVLHDGAGKPLMDIVSPQDNEAAADQIVDCLRGFAQDKNCAIHACLAGGRKTMGFYLGYGLSLYGRLQDRLSHVLVSPDFELHREFFYIPPEPKTLYVSQMVGNRVDERPLSTASAKIWLAEIPFVRLRDGLPERLLQGRARYTDAVQALQAALPDHYLILDVTHKKLTCGGLAVQLSPREFAFYLWHARRRCAGLAAVTWKDMLGVESPNLKAYMANYLEVLGNDKLHPDYLLACRVYATCFEQQAWQQVIHHVNDKIIKVLGKSRAESYLLQGKKVMRGSNLKAFELELPIERIQFLF